MLVSHLLLSFLTRFLVESKSNDKSTRISWHANERGHISSDKVALFRRNLYRSRGSKYVRPSLKVFGVKGDKGGPRDQPWVLSSCRFGPNRGRKAEDKEVSATARRKADLLSRIEEAGRVQLVRCITRVGSCEIIPSSFRAGFNASRGEESRLNCSRHAARRAARCFLVEKG